MNHSLDHHPLEDQHSLQDPVQMYLGLIQLQLQDYSYSHLNDGVELGASRPVDGELHVGEHLVDPLDHRVQVDRRRCGSGVYNMYTL